MFMITEYLDPAGGAVVVVDVDAGVGGAYGLAVDVPDRCVHVRGQ